MFATSVDGTDFLRGIGFDVPVSDVFYTRLAYEVYDFYDNTLVMLRGGGFVKF